MISKKIETPQFDKIPKLTSSGNYYVHVPWRYLYNWCEEMVKDLDPEFQRGHVWSKIQQVRYIEFILSEGTSSKDIYWNCKGWMNNSMGDYPLVLVDGKQRMQAVTMFMDNKIKIFGYYYKEYTNKLPMFAEFIMHVNNLKTYQEVLQWYLELNFYGTPHSKNELIKVENLIATEISKSSIV